MHRELRWKLVQRDSAAAETRGKVLRALQRAVGERHVARVLRGKVGRGKLDHFAGADKERALVADARIDSLGEAHRGGGH